MPENTVPFIISARWIAPVIPEGVLLENHSLVIRGNEIIDLMDSHDAREKYPDSPVTELGSHIVTPGLVNAHGHAAMHLLRGYADDRELMDWLQNYIWPVEGKMVDWQFVYDGATLAVAEMVRTGTTCAADLYFFPEATAQAFSDHKFRGQVGMPVLEFPSAWAADEDDYIHKGLEFRDDHVKNNPLITTAFAPHSPYTVSDRGFERILVYSEELQVPIHLHLHETAAEVSEAVQQTGKRPFARMADLGLLSP
ncbi:MAG: amidohydrolase family protein, partial [Pseudomonadales bacterium]|nr:amidohydrolase family protein [Pseudomonadales bacterium]